MNLKSADTGLESRLGGSEPWLLFHRIWIQSAASTWRVTAICSCSFRGSDAAFWSLQARGTHMVHRQSCRQNTHTHIFFFFILNADTASFYHILIQTSVSKTSTKHPKGLILARSETGYLRDRTWSPCHMNWLFYLGFLRISTDSPSYQKHHVSLIVHIIHCISANFLSNKQTNKQMASQRKSSPRHLTHLRGPHVPVWEK